MQKRFVLAAALIAAGCSQEPAIPPAATPQTAPTDIAAPKTRRITAAGDVEWPTSVALPDNAFLRVRLLDISRADAAAAPLAEETYPVDDGSPVKFSLAARTEINPRARLSVSAQISDGAALFYTSDTNNPAPLPEGARDLSITLVPVEAAPGAGAGGMPATPAPVAYRCGEDRVEIAIEAGAAYVTGPDGDREKLDKLGQGDTAPQVFTNGRVTVFFDGSEMDGLILRLARGKAAAIYCDATQ